MTDPAAFARRSYLRPAEVRALMGWSQPTLSRRLRDGRLPALTLAPGLRRIEAQGLVPLARPALPAGPAWVEVDWLAELWQVSPATLQRLARRGGLPLSWDRSRWVMHRRVLTRFVLDHTRGDAPEGQG